MSPEQVNGDEITPASDLFSLGALLYHCCQGKAAADAPTAASVLQKVANTKVKISRPLNKQTPRWFLRLIERLLSKDPKERPASAEEVIRCIDGKQAPRGQRLRPKLAWAAGVALCLAAVLTQFPVVANLLNRQFAAWRGHEFLILNRIVSAGTLAEAVQAARPNETIEIHSDRTILIPAPIVIPVDKPLTIRATEGTGSELEINFEGAAGFICSSRLTLERLRLYRPKDHSQTKLISVESGSLTITHCAITFEANRSLNFSTAIAMNAGSSVNIENSLLLGSWTTALRIGGGSSPETTRIRVYNSTLGDLGSIYFDNVAPDRQVEVSIAQSTFTGPTMFGLRPGGAPPKIRISCEASVIHILNSLWWSPDLSLTAFKENVFWQGKDNLYSASSGFLHGGRFPDQRGGASAIDSHSDWIAMPNINEENSGIIPLWSQAQPLQKNEISASRLDSISRPFLKNYPGIGCDLSRCGP
jgi:hypothetical protein